MLCELLLGKLSRVRELKKIWQFPGVAEVTITKWHNTKVSKYNAKQWIPRHQEMPKILQRVNSAIARVCGSAIWMCLHCIKLSRKKVMNSWDSRMLFEESSVCLFFLVILFPFFADRHYASSEVLLQQQLTESTQIQPYSRSVNRDHY